MGNKMLKEMKLYAKILLIFIVSAGIASGMFSLTIGVLMLDTELWIIEIALLAYGAISARVFWWNGERNILEVLFPTKDK
jgi:hypothetical protein